MPKFAVKLVPSIDEEWAWLSPTYLGLLLCPVCSTPVGPMRKADHIKWHQDLADVLMALGRGG